MSMGFIGVLQYSHTNILPSLGIDKDSLQLGHLNLDIISPPFSKTSFSEVKSRTI